LTAAIGAWSCVQVDPRGVPGVKELAVPFNSLDDALHARDALAAIEAKLSAAEPSYPPLSSTVMVVGAGYAGESTIPANTSPPPGVDTRMR
jgi:NADH dehydrogenase FAD-containing subunit